MSHFRRKEWWSHCDSLCEELSVFFLFRWELQGSSVVCLVSPAHSQLSSGAASCVIQLQWHRLLKTNTVPCSLILQRSTETSLLMASVWTPVIIFLSCPFLAAWWFRLALWLHSNRVLGFIPGALLCGVCVFAWVSPRCSVCRAISNVYVRFMLLLVSLTKKLNPLLLILMISSVQRMHFPMGIDKG